MPKLIGTHLPWMTSPIYHQTAFPFIKVGGSSVLFLIFFMTIYCYLFQKQMTRENKQICKKIVLLEWTIIDIAKGVQHLPENPLLKYQKYRDSTWPLIGASMNCTTETNQEHYI